MRSGPLAAALVFLAACGGNEAKPGHTTKPEPDAGAHPAAAPDFRVEGGFVRDHEGRALILRGANVAGAHKQKPYFSFHTLPDLQKMRDEWGMNSARFLITWAAVEPEKGQYDEAYLDALAERIEWCKQAGLLVVLDMHQDVYGEGFAIGGGDGAPRWTCDEAKYQSFVPSPDQWFLNYLSPEVSGCYDGFWSSKELRQHYADAWAHVAERLADHDSTIVGFDVMNEPYWGNYAIVNFETDLLAPFYGEVVAAVRKVRPHWLAFLEPASSRNLGVPTHLTPFSFGDVVYAPHSYDKDAESGKGFDPTHRAAVTSNLADLGAEAKSLNAALWVGEYGGIAAQPGIFEYMDAQYDGLATALGGSSYWAYDKGSGYAILEDDGAEKPELMKALVRPWPERVAGDPVSYAFDDATLTFTLTYRPDAKIGAPTEIVVPARVYPNGYSVSCDGCASEKDTGVLRVTKPAKGASMTVTITPG